MSEAPVLHPLTPLHEFLEKLGRPPDRDALTIYIGRLREMVRRLRTLLAACSVMVDHFGWPSELGFTDSATMCQGFKITEKLRKVMESGAELLPEVTLSRMLPVFVLCQASNACANFGQPSVGC